MSESRTLERDTKSPRRARRFVAERLEGYDQGLVENASLMASELVTNSIRHATGRITILLDIADGAVRIAVSDAGPSTPVVRHPSPEDPSGRGLQVVAALADDWGMTVDHGDGNTVWFSLRLDESTAGDGHRHDGHRWDGNRESGGVPEDRRSATRPTTPAPGPTSSKPTNTSGAACRVRRSSRVQPTWPSRSPCCDERSDGMWSVRSSQGGGVRLR